MFVLTLLVVMPIWTAANSDCGFAPSVNLNCEDFGRPYSEWSSGDCAHSQCEAYLECFSANGSHNEMIDHTCPDIGFIFGRVPFDYYFCTVTINYQYSTPPRSSPNATESCMVNKMDLTNDDHFESVGESHEVNCTLYTGQAVNSNDVSINWSGPNGVIANDSSRINVITTTSNGYIHTSTLQFSYISEKDEDISYNCTAVLSRKNESLSYHKSFSMSNLSIPSPSVSVTALDDRPIIGKPYSMECNVIVAKGIIGNVVITWMTNGTEKSRVNYTTWGNNSEYVDIYNTSRLHFNDTNTTYSCEVVITGTHAVVNSSSAITIDNITVVQPIVSVTALVTNPTAGDSFQMECNVTVTKGIVGNVDILWTKNGTVIRTMNYTVGNANSTYRDILNITELQFSDNNTVYYCDATVNTSITLNGSANYTLQIAQTPPSTVSTTSAIPTESHSQANPLIAIMISTIVAFIMIGFIVAFVSINHHKLKRALLNVMRRIRKSYNEDDEHKIPDFDDNNYSVIGKDEASTVEHFRITRSISRSQMPKLDEECSSIASCVDSMTNEEMLIHVYGENVSNKHHNPSKYDNGYYSDTSMSPKKLLPNTSVSGTKRLHSNSSGDYIQTDATPYCEESVALQQHIMSPLSDTNIGYSLFSQGNQDLQINSVNNSASVPVLTNQGEYFDESMAVNDSNTSIDRPPIKVMGYLDYNTAISQSSTEQTVPFSHDPGSVHKPSTDTDSFPCVALNEDLITPLNDAKENISDFSPYLQKVTDCRNSSSSSQELDSAYIDHYSLTMQHDSTAMKMTIADHIPFHKTNSASSINIGYIKESSDVDGYISEQ